MKHKPDGHAAWKAEKDKRKAEAKARRPKSEKTSLVEVLQCLATPSRWPWYIFWWL